MRCMKVVLPEPAMPMQTMATGGFCSVVAMMERLVVVVVVVVEELLMRVKIWLVLGILSSQVLQQSNSRYSDILSMFLRFNVVVVVVFFST